MTKEILSLCCCCLLSVSINAQRRIINGTPVVPPNQEWMAGLSGSSDPQDHFCGGILIADDWVMTAAHCLEGEQPQNVSVFFKVYYLSTPLNGFLVRQSDSLIMHPFYDGNTNDNDIGLVHLEQPVNIEPVLLPAVSDDYLIAPGRLHKIIGWGATDTFFSWGSDTLLQATLPIVDDSICNLPIAYDEEVTDNMICAGYMTGGTDACQGDSGGPLLTQEGDNWYATGIVSWGYGCASPNFPGIYTKVINYIGWIRQHVDSLQQPPTGINEINNSSVLINYEGQSIVVWTKGNIEIQRIQLLTLNGVLVYNEEPTDARNNYLNIQQLAQGMYVAKILTNEGIITKKIIRWHG